MSLRGLNERGDKSIVRERKSEKDRSDKEVKFEQEPSKREKKKEPEKIGHLENFKRVSYSYPNIYR